MVSVTSASRYITSASRYHPRYQSRSSMFNRGLIPRNFAELTEAVPKFNRSLRPLLGRNADDRFFLSRRSPNIINAVYFFDSLNHMHSISSIVECCEIKFS